MSIEDFEGQTAIEDAPGISREDALGSLPQDSVIDPRQMAARLGDGVRSHFVHDQFVNEVYPVGQTTIIDSLRGELKPYTMNLAFEKASAPATQTEVTPSTDFTFDPTKPGFNN